MVAHHNNQLLLHFDSEGQGSVTQKLIVRQPRPLSVHFESQGDSTGRPVGGNLSPIAI